VRLRLRPILMTSFAFILGVVPLILATGAGHEMRRALGVAVFAGMLGVTLFGIFLTPVFFNVIEWCMEAPPFSSERARQAGRALRVVAGVLTLGLAWLPALVARGFRWRPALVRPAPARPPAASANGATKAHAAVPARDGNGQAADGEPKRVLRK
jgi:multidrug efflux pump